MSGRDPAVLSSPVALELLTSRIPARIGYLTTSGEVRVVPVWFHWDGADMVIATFGGSHKLRHVRTGHRIAATVDTEAFPYQALQIRGPVTVTPHVGVVPEYLVAAKRYLGDAEGAAFVAGLSPRPVMSRIALRPDWAKVLDMRH